MNIGTMHPIILPNANVEPTPNDLYNVEYDSKINGIIANMVHLIKNLNKSNPINK